MHILLFSGGINNKSWFLLLLLFFIAPVYAENKGSIARAQFTTEIQNREPVDQVLAIKNDITTVYFFTDVRHMEGRTVTHNWEYNGQIIAKKKFKIKGPRWRIFSKKELQPSMTGKWTVIVRDDQGWPLTVSIFHYLDSQSGEKNMILPLP